MGLITRLRNKQPTQKVNRPHTVYIKPQKNSVKEFDKIFRILTRVEKGESPEYLMWLYSVPQEVLLSWMEKADVINSIVTEKMKSRHRPSQRYNVLITPLPSAQADIDEITLFRTNLRNQAKKITAAQRKSNILKICKIIFCRSTTSSSYILFRHYSLLTFFLNFLSYFPKNRWFISINASDKKDIKLWKNAAKGCNIEMNIQFTQDKRNPNGQAKVHLLAKQAPENLEQNKWKKYSVNTVKFVMHIIAISELSLEELESMTKL